MTRNFRNVIDFEEYESILFLRGTDRFTNPFIIANVNPKIFSFIITIYLLLYDAQKHTLFNLLRWSDVPRSLRIFGPKIVISPQF